MRRARTAERGFTLIELLVVVGVIGILAAAAVPAVESITGANARKAAGELAGTLRAVFDTAAMRAVTCRVALDLDGRAFWAECAKGRAGMERDPDRAARDEELADRFPDEKDAELRRLLAQSKFGAFEDRLVKKRELPGSTGFGEIRLEGRREPVTKGMAYVYFFPGGQAQAAQVPVVDGNNVFTVVTRPFSGQPRVVLGKAEWRE